VSLSNYAAHKPSKVRAWLTSHPRWTGLCVLLSCSSLHAVEGFLVELIRRHLMASFIPTPISRSRSTASSRA
jgi:hypothetical protein